MPPGASTSTVVPLVLPINALAIGEVTEIVPSLGLASGSPTICQIRFSLLRERSLVFRVLNQVGLVGDRLLDSPNKARSRDSNAVPQFLFKGNMTRSGYRKSCHWTLA